MKKIKKWNEFIIESKNDFDLDKMYKDYNKKYFSNKLPDIKVVWDSLKGKAGVTLSKIAKNKKNKKEKIVDIMIKISNIYNKSETQVKSVLLHEMIHVYLLNKGIIETKGGDKSHGTEFEKKRKEIEKKAGIPITVTEDINRSNIDNNTINDLSYDVIHYKKDGKNMIAVFKEGFLSKNKKEILERFKKMKKDKNVRGKLTFFNSEDGTFLKYPVKDEFSSRFYELDFPINKILSNSKVLYNL